MSGMLAFADTLRPRTCRYGGILEAPFSSWLVDRLEAVHTFGALEMNCP